MAHISLLFLILLLLFLLAVVLSRGKGAFLVAGYKSMSKTEKEKYDEVAICKFFGKTMYGVCLCMLLIILSKLLNIPVLFWISLVLLIVLLLFIFIYVNTSERFRKE